MSHTSPRVLTSAELLRVRTCCAIVVIAHDLQIRGEAAFQTHAMAGAPDANHARRMSTAQVQHWCAELRAQRASSLQTHFSESRSCCNTTVLLRVYDCSLFLVRSLVRKTHRLV